MKKKGLFSGNKNIFEHLHGNLENESSNLKLDPLKLGNNSKYGACSIFKTKSKLIAYCFHALFIVLLSFCVSVFCCLFLYAPMKL